ncbi:hypothetical protein TNCV_1234851 [Trichonephila clavipes]|nr:hypothetical protein TNCV_1234851 [Trichonephila clavipes]
MPLPGHSSILSISTRKKLHPGVPPTTTREAVCRSSGKTRHGAYLEYTHNIVIQHQDEDPTGKPHSLSASLTLQQCLFGDTEERCHQPIDGSGLTPASRLQRSVGQRYSQYTIVLLTGRLTRQTFGLAKQRC